MLKEFQPLKISDTPWTCYRDPKSRLVYFLHSKCACTFYKKLFFKLDWVRTVTTEIDWDKDIVFSYIRDPLTKHRLGLIEWFYYHNKTAILEQNVNNKDFFLMLSHVAYLDIHSMSIYEHLGDNASRVHWIPIDQPTVDHKRKTIELLEQESSIDQESVEWFLNLQPSNVSTGFKKQCFQMLMELPVTSLVIKSIDYDKCLYDAITTPQWVEPANYQLRIQQLEEQGHTNLQAQKIADNEVATGEYIHWPNQ